MRAPAECQMPIIRALQVERVGIVEALRIAIAGGNHRDNRLPAPDVLASERDVFVRHARRVLDGAFEAQQLFDRGRDESWIVQ